MTATPWALGPFSPPLRIAIDGSELRFDCPIAGRTIAWAAKDVFNPGAIVHDGRVCLLVRGEDAVGRYGGTSRIGLATSEDGVHFTIEPEPVLFPADDCWQAWEWPGGIEDPRLVASPEGGYVCTYTAFDGKVGCLFIATSPDLRVWTKHGPAFAQTPYVRRPTKSGAIITVLEGGLLVAARVDGKYWMYWGEGQIYAAVSDDLVRWTPVEAETAPERYLTWEPGAGFGPSNAWQINYVAGPRGLRPLAGPRPHRFDSLLTEPGPPALCTDDGIMLIYNGANHQSEGEPDTPPLAYQPGQILFDARDPTAVIGRMRTPFLTIDPVEASGQVGNVCFAQSLVAFQDNWLLYLGFADSRIGVSRAEMTKLVERSDS